MITRTAVLTVLCLTLSQQVKSQSAASVVDTPIDWVELKSFEMSTVGTAISVRIDENGRAIQEESEVAVLNIGVRTKLDIITALRLEVAPDKRPKDPDTVSFALTGLTLTPQNRQPQAQIGRYVRYTLPRPVDRLESPNVEIISNGQRVGGVKFKWTRTTERGRTEGPVTGWEMDMGRTLAIERVSFLSTFDETHSELPSVIAVLAEDRRESWSGNVRSSRRPTHVDVTRPSFKFVHTAASAGQLTKDNRWTVTTRDGEPASAVFVLAIPVRETDQNSLTLRVAMNVKQQGSYGDFRIFATDHQIELPLKSQSAQCAKPQ